MRGHAGKGFVVGILIAVIVPAGMREPYGRCGLVVAETDANAAGEPACRPGHAQLADREAGDDRALSAAPAPDGARAAPISRVSSEIPMGLSRRRGSGPVPRSSLVPSRVASPGYHYAGLRRASSCPPR